MVSHINRAIYASQSIYSTIKVQTQRTVFFFAEQYNSKILQSKEFLWCVFFQVMVISNNNLKN